MSRKRITSVTRLAMGGPCLSAQKKAARITCCLSCTVGALALPCLARPRRAVPSLAANRGYATIAPLVPLPSRATPGQAEPRPAMPSQSAPVRVLNYRIFISSAMRLARSISACRSFGILPRVVLVTLFVAVLAARLCSLTAAAIRRW